MLVRSLFNFINAVEVGRWLPRFAILHSTPVSALHNLHIKIRRAYLYHYEYLFGRALAQHSVLRARCPSNRWACWRELQLIIPLFTLNGGPLCELRLNSDSIASDQLYSCIRSSSAKLRFKLKIHSLNWHTQYCSLILAFCYYNKFLKIIKNYLFKPNERSRL